MTLRATVRLAWRRLTKDLTFSATCVAIIAINLAVFGALNGFWDALIVRPQPGITNPTSVLRVQPEWDRRGIPYPTYKQYQMLVADAPATVSLAYYTPRIRPVQLGSAGHTILVEAVSTNFFSVLGVSLSAGVGLGDSTNGADHRAVISRRFWRTAMNADEHALGRRITIGSDEGYVIAGIAPDDFHGPEGLQQADIWIPYASTSDWGFGRMIGRARDGFSSVAVQAELETLWSRIVATPESRAEWRGSRLRVSALGGGLHPESYQVVGMIMGGATAITLLALITAAVNLAGLLLTRAMSRRHELAVRRALGARQRDLIGEPFAEVLLLFLLALMLGFALTRPVGATLIASLNVPAPFAAHVPWDLRTIATPLGLALLGAIGCALAPGIWASRTSPGRALQSGSDRAGGDLGGRRLQSMLVIAQVAITFALMTASLTVAVRTARQVTRTLGVAAPQSLLVIHTPEATAQASADRASVVTDVARRVTGDDRIATALSAPAENGLLRMVMATQGSGPWKSVRLNVVSPQYISVIGTRVLRGRDFANSDRPGGVNAVLLSRAAAEQFSPGGNAVGQEVMIGREHPYRAVVIGVVEDVVYDMSAQFEPVAYVLDNQFGGDFGKAVVLARTNVHDGQGLASHRADSLLRVAMPTVALPHPIETLQQAVNASNRGDRALVALLTAAVAVAFAIALMGMFGLMNYRVQRQRHSIAVRLALGATSFRIRRHYAAQGAGLTLAGVVIGGLLVVLVATSPFGVMVQSYSTALGAGAAVSGIALLAAALAAGGIAVGSALMLKPATVLRGE